MSGQGQPEFNPPDCYGTFCCSDDCMVSCKYWEDCKEAEENDDEENGEEEL